MDIFPGEAEFCRLRRKGGIIPLFSQIPLNHETPAALFERLTAGEDISFLLDSGKGGSRIARYSFIGCNPDLIFKSKGNLIEVITDKEKKSYQGNPMNMLSTLLNENNTIKIDYLSHFWGGGVGYISYDTCHLFEDLPRTTVDDLSLPDIFFIIVDEVIVVDHLEDTIKIIVCIREGDSYKRCARRIEEIRERLISKVENHSYARDVSGRAAIPDSMAVSIGKDGLRANLTKDDFIRMVRRAKEYIADGDIYQTNLSQRLEMDYSGDPLRLYKKLRDINPSPFAGFLRLKDISIVSSSPERLIKVDGDHIETRPIAGTRPRGRDRIEDERLSKDLLLNEKERAEHLMLVDLERNDLGRICQYGTVEVDEMMSLEAYSHVWHIVSNIRGRLRNSINIFDILRSCFPGGTITGCPKVRCMEIIDELEPTQRGTYTGSMGYIGYAGDIDLNILIRTILIKDGKGYISVGAGIVADSDPESEYLETLNKARGMIGAIQSVNGRN